MSKTDVGKGWVRLRDPKLVPERLRRPVVAKAQSMKAVAERAKEGIESESGVDESDFMNLSSFNDLVAIALIEEWSFDLPITVDGLLSLPGSEYDQIQKITAPLFTQMLPNFEEGPDDPVSPTESSDE